MRKIFNFSPGPAMLPEEVLLQAQEEMLDWQGTGMSIMEVGHRSDCFKQLAFHMEADLRDLMRIPAHYHILFLTGGATAQFAMIPLNLLRETGVADYVDTGIWSKRAIVEAKRYANIHIAATAHQDEKGWYVIPPQQEWCLRKEAVYLHYTPNETIEGIEFNWVPKVERGVLIADMSSMILSCPIDINQYGLIYASAQKNIGQAGTTLVIIHDDLVHAHLPEIIPSTYQYYTYRQHHSLYNTPPTYSWYILSLMLSWMKGKGGVDAFTILNQRKAMKLYDCIDQYPDFYRCRVHPSCRSRMNVSFHLPTLKLTADFLTESDQAGLKNLKGHALLGGIRVSIYNAMPEAGVEELIRFMHYFVQQYP